jgi:hypothetical protein
MRYVSCASEREREREREKERERVPHLLPVYTPSSLLFSNFTYNLLPNMARRSTIAFSFSGGLTLGGARTKTQRQKPAPKKAAPKKPSRASRVVDDSDDDEEVEPVK